jgi:hypothetical protein
MGTAFALALLAGCVLLLAPIHLSLAFRWDEGTERPWSFVLRLWGFPLVRLPGSARQQRNGSDSEPRATIPPWLNWLIDFARDRWREQRAREREGKGGGHPFRVLGRLINATVLRPTRRIRLELGGIDPALLAALHGLFLSFRPLLPSDDILGLKPDWTAFRPRVRLLWSLRASCAGMAGAWLSSLREGRARRNSDAFPATSS